MKDGGGPRFYVYVNMRVFTNLRNRNAVFAEKTTYLEPKPLFYFIQLLKKPFQKISENFINNEKNAYHTISIYGNCMIKVFFKKQKPQFFHHPTVLLESNSRRN